MVQPSAALLLEGLGRTFGTRRALWDVGLEMAPGEIVGLVGPNGAGKTTLIKLIAGFLRPDAGRVRVLGMCPRRRSRQVMERVRFAFAPPPLFEPLTAREHLVHLPRLGGTEVSRSEIDRALQVVGLDERADEPVRTFSTGMRQRLTLAQAILPMPELLVLDEPTEGLDPLAVLELRSLLVLLREEHNLTILLSSHLLVEIEELVDRMLVLSNGETLFLGTPGELTEHTARLRLKVDRAEAAQEAFGERGIASQMVGDELELALDGTDLEGARAILRARGLALTGFRTHRATLEEALLERLRQGKGRP